MGRVAGPSKGIGKLVTGVVLKGGKLGTEGCMQGSIGGPSMEISDPSMVGIPYPSYAY